MNTTEFQMGISWGATYGLPPGLAEPFLPQARQLGATASRVTLYWSQLEPQPGVQRWDELDAYLAQLATPEEGLITLASASPWATRTGAWVFPSSPAKDVDAYRAFLRRVVERVRGRVRFFQNETEPSNPFFWSGTAEEYAAQQKLFYRTVREADADAVVVLAGFDGLFDPTGADPLPGEAATLSFLKNILEGVDGAFDVFDIHLYADPYTIPARIAAVRQMMRAAGAERPVIAGEYAGPAFFEFPANRRWYDQRQGPGASPENARRLRANAAMLAAETRIFLPGADAETAARLLRLQSQDLVVRNLLALASGVTRTAFFDLWHDAADGDAPNSVLWGSLRLLEHDATGALRHELPLARPFQRLASALAGATLAQPIPIAAHAEIYAFRVERQQRGPLLVAWRRPAKLGAMCDPLAVEIPWQAAATRGILMDGSAAVFTAHAGRLAISVSDLPVLID